MLHQPANFLNFVLRVLKINKVAMPSIIEKSLAPLVTARTRSSRIWQEEV